MAWLRAIWSEFVGLFVDDGSFALAIVVWIVAARLLLPRLGLPTSVPPALLFVGLLAILLESAARRSRTDGR